MNTTDPIQPTNHGLPQNPIPAQEEFRSRILQTLEQPARVAYTIEHVAQALSMDERSLVRAMKADQHLRGLIKIYPGRNADGELLLTTKRRFYKTAPFRKQLIDLLANHPISLDDVV